MTKKYILDPRLLVDLSLPENIYLLGRFWADGNLRKYEINLFAKEGDAEHMFPFFQKMGLSIFHKRQRFVDKKPFGVPSYVIRISRKSIADFFYKFDYAVKSKTSPTKILTEIDKSMHPLFWRGFFDGDGSLYVGNNKARSLKLSFWGSIDQDWGDLINLYNDLKVNYSIIKYKRKNARHCSSAVQIIRRYDMLKVMNWVYSSYDKDKIGLPRKYNSYKKLQDLAEKTFKKSVSINPGISYISSQKLWRATIYPSQVIGIDKPIYCGSYKNIYDAISAREERIKNMGLLKMSPNSEKLYQSKERE